MAVNSHTRKLEEALKIGDRTERQRLLLNYARSLNVNIEMARKANNEIDEDALTVLIYNAQRTRTFFQLRNTGAWFGIILILFMILAGIFLAIKMKMIRIWQ